MKEKITTVDPMFEQQVDESSEPTKLTLDADVERLSPNGKCTLFMIV
jgi:hypothetical protein